MRGVRRRATAEALLRGLGSSSSSSSSSGLGGGKTVVFVNAIATARRVAATLELLGVAAKPLHAELQQRQRLKVNAYDRSSRRKVNSNSEF